MTFRIRIASWIYLAGLIGVGAHALPATAGDAASDPNGRLCEYGITLALSGHDAAAESVFVSLLSRVPHDARALNNLGNLRLWKSDPDVALAFYARAGEADSADAGIMLNEATALMLEGDDETARGRADEAMRQAGGPAAAARLLGLRYDELDEDAPRASDHAQVSRDEVLALLRAAAHAVPADTAGAKAKKAGGSVSKRGKSLPSWRSAGARGAAESDVAAVVYWKH